MKKVMFLLVFCSLFGVTLAQRSDSLRRAAGFYLSPGITNLSDADSKNESNLKFGGSIGFRFINKLSHGFFIEGGVGLGFFGYESPVQQGQWSYYNEYPIPPTIYNYTYKYTMNEVNWMVPFLAGYKTQKGKVRFQGALGLAFHLKTIEVFDIKYLDGTRPQYDYFEGRGNNTEASFGTSFFAIARAGISIPLKNRINIEILPTARYRMFYFTNYPMDLTKSIMSKERPWSLGLDIGLMISLDDKEVEEEYEKNASGDAYTYQYNDEKTSKPAKKKLLNKGPKNAAYIEFGGNGLLYSMNYERTVFRNGIVNIQARGGVGFTFKKYCIPLGANIALGTSRKKFEAGLTVTMNNFNRGRYGDIDGDEGGFNVSLDPSIAFRLEANSHLFLRLAVMTHYFPVTGGIMPGVGVSLGGCF